MPKPATSAVRIALVGVGLLIALGYAVGDTAFGAVLTVVAFLLLVFVMTRLPLRNSVMTLMFLGLALPNPADCTPVASWRPPFYTIGDIVLSHLNTVDRNFTALSWCSFSGMDICIVTLLIIAFARRTSGSQIDTRGAVATPKPLVRLAYLALLAPVYTWTLGMLRGGDFHWSLWQIDQVVHLPLLFLLFHLGLRGPKDHPALARVVLLAAGYKALLALYVVWTVPPPDTDGNGRLMYATSHSDSMLFACALVLILATLLERLGRRSRRLAFFLVPLIAAGIWANNRRIAWVQVGLVLSTVFFASRDSPLKRRIRRALLVSTPALAMYLLIGWESGRSIFKPARLVRSVVDAQTDSSSFWRELENFDLISTIRSHPVFGTGYGHGYDEIIELPKVNYSLELYAPHNCILGLWSYCGIFGYTALTLLWVAGVYFAMRAYYVATDNTHRAAAMVSFGAVLIYLIQCWGDLGLGSWTGVFMVAPAVAVSGKLAKATGAWGARKPKIRPPEVRAVPAEQAA